MANSSKIQTPAPENPAETVINPAKTTRMLLRMLRAAQPLSRVEIARRLNVNRRTITDITKPMISSGLLREDAIESPEVARSQGRPPIGLSFVDSQDFFVGLNLGVRHSQVGLTTLGGEILAEEEFVTPPDAAAALHKARENIEDLCAGIEGRTLRTIGVSVPGPVDALRRKLLYAPHLDWRDVNIADELQNGLFGKSEAVPITVENDATAAAIYEARLKMRDAKNDPASNFILVRSGTGIGVGLVLDGEIYRGSGGGLGMAGEFGHMTIAADGKPCVCGNRGCWEKYASASSAASLYLGDHARSQDKNLRFVEIVGRAEAGETRARRTLEKIGHYLGIGIANVIMGIGVSQVIVSGRLVYGWKYLEEPLREAIKKSIVGKTTDWTIVCGEPKGSALGGALEVAVEDFISRGFVSE
ncbi:MAG: ROK family transcriptional regulator [Acidobacteriota bacterium]|nr:ROK family transcriptional regulator [Acidobacteriota bacterium]